MRELAIDVVIGLLVAACSMRIELDGGPISIPPFESVKVGKSLFTNAGALTHRPDYMELWVKSNGAVRARSAAVVETR